MTGEAFIVVLNCGSSSIKFALFPVTVPAPAPAAVPADARPLPREPAWRGKVQGIGSPEPRFDAGGQAPTPVTLDPAHPYRAALDLIREQTLAWLDGRGVAAVAHRVVHGGSQYSAPVRVDATVLADLGRFIPLAPLHQPFALEAIAVLLDERPDLAQVACFDTAFHRTLPEVEQMLPLPHAAWERGLRRYGFHGLSYEYVAEAVAERHGDLARGRTLVAHLGSGASLCALEAGRSVATTMGFSALDGLMMGTRCGSLDPGAVLYLMEIEKLSLAEVGRILYHESGLLGVSGLSADPRVLLESEAGAPRARAALDLYVRRIIREIGALVAVLGGIDLLVFTAGIGENNATIRERVCAGLAFLGLRLDPGANAANGARPGLISTADSRVAVAVEPTNEEWIAARHAASLLASSAPLASTDSPASPASPANRA